jgi:DNA-binding NarL/FixJ family response regulator
MSDPERPLTEKQLEALALRAQGLTVDEIAAKLFLSRDSVKDRLWRTLVNGAWRNMYEACAWYGKAYG